MSKTTTTEVLWLADVEEHDYPAARSYLSLIYPDETAADMVTKLRAADLTQFKAKDVFRASGLSLLGVSNSHIVKNNTKIANGTGLSPLLLVRDVVHGRVVVADGYHRMCAVYGFDEDAMIRCKII
jgi:hypothetical protein